MKMTIIGGAGVRTPLFVRALLKYSAELGLTEVTLMDIDAEKLGLIGALCAELVRRGGSPFTLTLANDARQALRDASFVVTTIRVGFEGGRVLDERIALKHGVLGQETTGPGGFAMALRSIPAILGYADLMDEVCPDAWLLNFTNPAGLVAQAISEARPHRKVAGICDTPPTMQREVARVLGLPRQEIAFTYFGLNHLSWISAAKYRGLDQLPRLLASDELLGALAEFPFEPRLVRLLGLIPNEYLYYFYYRERAVANLLAAGTTRGEQIQELTAGLLSRLRDVYTERNPEQGLAVFHQYIEARHASYMTAETGQTLHAEETDEGSEGYAGVALAVARAVRSGSPHDLILNVPNGGAMPGMQTDDVVESVCTVDAAGARPLRIPDIPEHALRLMQQVKLYERLTVRAVAHRSRDLAVQALMAHPLVGSYSLSTSLVGEYLDAHRGYVGDWT